MDELERAEAKTPDVLHGLAMQGRMFLQNAALNFLQFGRVLAEAKPLVAHGEWEAWVGTNFGISERRAQTFMQAYRRFGSMEQVQGVAFSKIEAMLSLPSGEEEQFLETHDVAGLSVREMKEEVRKAREAAKAEADGAILRERQAREAAEARVRELESRPPEVPEDVICELNEKDRKLLEYRQEIDRVGRSCQELIEQRNAANRELSEARRDLKETEDMLAENQAEYDRMQSELLSAQSALAKGDAERIPAQKFTPDVFASAVRAFVGTCARMPQMRQTFGMMTLAEKREYEELLSTVEKWASDSRKALEYTMIDGEAAVR